MILPISLEPNDPIFNRSGVEPDLLFNKSLSIFYTFIIDAYSKK
jgi:hypothetical protein